MEVETPTEEIKLLMLLEIKLEYDIEWDNKPFEQKLYKSPPFVQVTCRFGETLFKKSLESTFAWKSPWLSFVPGPTIYTDITIEDIGYFTSPGERRYDALGLMEQLSEHTASKYANARQILGEETPDSILNKIFSKKCKKICQ
ncbi:hypothetical protein L1887_22661 [Cichorium endivia]|nr:hypothetical protein L1887_22661 [Cichorium endivia]